MPREQVLGSVTSFVHETHHAFMSEDISVHRHLAQIYRKLGEQCMLIRQLRLVVEQPREPKDERTMTASNCCMHVPRKLADQVLECDTVEDSDSGAGDIFLIAFPGSPQTILPHLSLHANFSGSPDYNFELTPFFYQEQ